MSAVLYVLRLGLSLAIVGLAGCFCVLVVGGYLMQLPQPPAAMYWFTYTLVAGVSLIALWAVVPLLSGRELL